MHPVSRRCRFWLTLFHVHQKSLFANSPSNLNAHNVAVHVRHLASVSGGGLTRKCAENALDVLKLGFRFTKSHEAVAIADERKNHTYGEILHSSFQLSLLLQSLLREERLVPVSNASNEGNGTRDNNALQEASRTPGVFKKIAAENEVFVATETAKNLSILEGARVGIMGKPCAEFLAGMWGTWLSGAVAVPLAVNHPEAELSHVLSDAGVSIVFATEDYRNLLEPVVKKCCARLYLLPSATRHHNDVSNTQEHGLLSIEQMEREIQKVSSTIREDQAALIIYTSGTTGKPKGVVHTHASIGAQVKMLAKAWEYSPKDRFLHCLPLHHVHGLINILLAPLFVGATVEFLPKFSARQVWHRWQESYSNPDTPANDAVTVFSGVGTFFSPLFGILVSSRIFRNQLFSTRL